jgi:hypothetical protein
MPTTAADREELQREFDLIARERLAARGEGISLDRAVTDPRFPTLRAFHQDLRDALLLEIPGHLLPWVGGLTSRTHDGGGAPPVAQLAAHLVHEAHDDGGRHPLRRALAEVLVFEAVRLRLLVLAWESEEFEQAGGDEALVDAVAAEEVDALLAEPMLLEEGIRPLTVMVAAASVSLSRNTSLRAEELLRTSDETRAELRLRARLRQTLRELRVTESVLLENALADLLGDERHELPELQDAHPVALGGMSRQAMDQRVSRGRRALAAGEDAWPRRRQPALLDLLRLGSPRHPRRPAGG